MHETAEDLVWLQRLLDASYAAANPYLRSIITEDRRLDAQGVVDAMGRMRVMALATTTSRAEPRVGPVDGIFYRGRLHFGSGRESLRARHVKARPAVSASVIEGVQLQITVHGHAREVSPADDPQLAALLVAQYGQAAWDDWMSGLLWARIEPDRMLTFRSGSAAA